MSLSYNDSHHGSREVPRTKATELALEADLMEHSERLLNRQEVEERFGISRRFLEISMMRGDGPPFIKLGRLVRYRIADIEAWLSQNRIVPGQA